MGLGPGGLDAQGVWQYGEDDADALASDLLNLGMDSVSTQLVADRARLTLLENPPFKILAAGPVAAQSTIILDGLTGYDEYEIILDLPESSVNNALTMQLRSAMATDGSSNYDQTRITGTGSSATASEQTGEPSWAISAGNRADKIVIARLLSLNIAQRTFLEVTGSTSNPSASNMQTIDIKARHRLAAAYDGVVVTVSSGTVTGSYVVKGTRYS